MPELTTAIARFAYGLKNEDLDGATIGRAKVMLLDYLASAMAGQIVNKPFNDIIVNAVSSMGESPESSVLFYDRKLPAQNAAFLNGAIGHGADIDDGHRMAQGHPAVVTLPAILALAQKYSLSGMDVLRAMVVGYDVFVRLGMALNPYHVLHGHHTSGTAGAVAAGAAAANLLGLDEGQAKNAIAFSCLQAAGLMEVVESGQLSKGFNTGKAAANGVFAVLLAKAGARAPDRLLEGRKGFLQAFAKDYDADEIVRDFGRPYRINTCYIKLYPCCRHMHCSIQIGRGLHAERPFAWDDIRKIRISLYQAGINLTGNIDIPENEDGAKFSLKYALATAMATGGYELKHLDVPNTITPEIVGLIKKMEIVLDNSLEDRAKGIRGTRIAFVLASGETKEYTVLVPKGDPEYFVTPEDIRYKLSFCAEGLYDGQRQQALLDYVDGIDAQPHLAGLFSLLSRSQEQ